MIFKNYICRIAYLGTIFLILVFFIISYPIFLCKIFDNLNSYKEILISCSNNNETSAICSNCELIVKNFKENNALYVAIVVCTSLIFITAIICLTIAICKCIQPKKEKCNSYDEALTEMLTRKNNEKKEEKNNNEQNKD